MNLLPLLCCFCGLLCVNCLYEDQIRKFDWHQQYLGEVQHLSIEKMGVSGRRFFIASNMNIVAAVSLRNGDLLWRQVMEENGSVLGFAHCDSSVVSLSQRAGTVVRAWDIALGHLLWEVTVSDTGNSTGDVICEPKRNQVIVAYGPRIRGLNLRDGSELWNQEATTLSGASQLRFFPTPPQHDLVLLALKQNLGTVVMVTLTAGGNPVGQPALLAAPWLITLDSCVVLSGESVAVVCLDQSGSFLHVATVAPPTSQWRTEPVTSVGLSPGSTSYRLSALATDLSLVMVTSQEGAGAVLRCTGIGANLHLLYKLHRASIGFATSQDGVGYLFTGFYIPHQPFRNLEVTVRDLATGTEMTKLFRVFHVAQHHGRPERLQALLFTKKDSAITYRLFLQTEDHALQLLQQNGRVLWLREESLASIVATEMVDLPVSDVQAKMDEEFGHNQGNVLEMFFKRITTQVSQLMTFLHDRISQHRKPTISSDPLSDGISNGDSASGSSQLSGEQQSSSKVAGRGEEQVAVGIPPLSSVDDLTRDDFNLHKMIIAASATGKLFGIDSRRGGVVWKYLVRSALPLQDGNVAIFQQRTTAHFPLQPQTLLLMRSKTTGRPIIFPFNPITGVPLVDVIHLPYDVTQAFMLPLTSEADNYTRPVLMLDKEAKVHVYPPLARLPVETVPIYLYTVDKATGRIQGYRVRRDTVFDRYVADCVWRMALNRDGQKIVAVASKPANEHLHSVGRILGDRSVLYKYYNPNLVALITEVNDTASPKSSITLYLIDVVTGLVVYSNQHRRCSGPVNLVHSENWVAYSYQNHKSYRVELSVLELYEKSSITTAASTNTGNGISMYGAGSAGQSSPDVSSFPGAPGFFLRAFLPASWFSWITKSMNKESDASPVDDSSGPASTTSPSETETFSSSLRGRSLLMPEVMRQAYIFASFPRVSAVSLTERGVTAKSVLFALESGSILELPKALLDPRRSLEMTPELQEEGVEPYVPEIGLNTFAVITYNQTVQRIRGIQTAPSGLESTSLVFAYGLDLFFTQVAPSKMYDVLKEDFDYFFIATVTLGMIAASFITQRLAARKALFRAWQ